MIKTLIIGLGKISLLYDIKKNKLSTNTHSGFLYNNKFFKIVGAVEKKINLIQMFKNYFSCKCFHSIEEAINNTKPNLVVVATSTNTHLRVFKEIIFSANNNIRAILFEKPVGKNLKEITEIKKILRKKKVKIFVNYSRDYENAFIKLNSFFLNTLSCKAEVSYNGGFVNNASHFISLFINFFGKVKKIELLKKKKCNGDFYIDCVLHFKNCTVNFQNNMIKNHHNFKIKYNNKNLLIYSNKSKYIYFNKIKSYKQTINTLKTGHLNIYKQIKNYFYKKNYFICNLDKAIYVHQIISRCINSKIIESK